MAATWPLPVLATNSMPCGVPQLRAACHRAETLLKQDDAKALSALDELDIAITRLASEARVSA